jgi:hypothetical protein
MHEHGLARADLFEIREIVQTFPNVQPMRDRDRAQTKEIFHDD